MIQSSVKRSYHRKNRAYVIMGKVFFRRRLSVTTLQNGCALLYHRTCDFSFGIALAVESMLGTSPFDALLVGLYRTFGLTIGSWEVVVGFVMIVGNALAERKMPEYFAFITSLITGIGIDSWLVILRLFDITNSGLVQWIYLLFSLIFSALGISFYLHSNIAPNPMDRSMLII